MNPPIRLPWRAARLAFVLFRRQGSSSNRIENGVLRLKSSASDRWLAVLMTIVCIMTASAICSGANTWDGGGATDDWNDALNWDNNLVPTFPVAITFSGNTRLTPNNNIVGATVQGITFDAAAGAFTVGGNPVTIAISGNPAPNPAATSSGIADGVANNSASAQVVNLGLTLGAGKHYFATGLGAGSLNLGGTITRQTAATATFYSTGGQINTTLANGSTGIIGGWATAGADPATSSWAANDGTGNIVAFTAFSNTFGAGATVSGTNASSNIDFTGGGNLTIPAATSLNTMRFSDQGGTVRTITLQGAVTIANGGGIFRTGDVAAQHLITGGSITAGTSGAAELIFRTRTSRAPAPSVGPPEALTIASLITNNAGGGAVTVVKTGYGVMRLDTSNNTFSGGLYINEGQLRPSAAGSMGTGPVYVAADAQMLQGGAVTQANPFFIAGFGPYEQQGGAGQFRGGALRFNSAGGVLSGTITLVGDSRIGARGGQATGTGVGGTVSGKITGNFNLDLNLETNQGTAGLASNMPTVTLSNSANDWGGNTTIGRGRVRIGGTGEVIPDGPGKGNVIIVGEQTSESILNLNSLTETVNGLSAAGDTSLVYVTNNTAGVGTLRVGNNGATSTFAGKIVDEAGKVQLVKIGNGTLTLSGTNAYTGGTTISGGTLQMASAGAIGDATNTLTVNTGGTLDANANNIVTGGLNGTGGTITTNVAGPVMLTVDTATTTNSFAGSIQNGSGTLSFVKTGAGQVILTGASTYTGDTDIQNGALIVNGATASAGAVKIQLGATLAGTGNTGNVTMETGGNIRPGASTANGVIGPLAANSLKVNGGDMRFDLASPGNNDQLIITGTAEFTTGNSSTITPYFSVAVPVTGSYTLLTAGTLTLNHTPTLNFPPNSRFTAGYNLSTPNTIKFDISGAAKTIRWTGETDGTAWDVGASGTQNWRDTGNVLERFFNFDSVTFDDSANPANRNVFLTTTVQPGSVTVNHDSGSTDYVIGGGGITGDFVTFTKLGTGKVKLNNTNSFGGGTFVKNGTLQLGSSLSLPAGTSVTLGDSSTNTSGVLDLGGVDANVGSLTVVGTGTTNTVGNSSFFLSTLTYAGSGTATFPGIVQDVLGTNNGQKVALTINSGSLTLSGNNSFSGGITINGGSLKAGSATALGLSSNSLTMSTGTTLDLNGNSATFAAFASNGGTITSTVAGAISLTVGDNTDTTFAGAIQNGSAIFSLTKNGTGTLTLSGANTYSGTTNITSGTLKMAGTTFAALGATTGGQITVGSGATLDLGGITTNNAAGGVGARQVNIAGAGPGGTGAALVNSSVTNGQQNAFQKVTLTANATIGGAGNQVGNNPGRFDLRAAQVGGVNVAKLDLAGFKLTKIGLNQVSLVATDVTAGDIEVVAGVLGIESTSSVPAATKPDTTPYTVTFDAGSQFQVFGTAANQLNMTRQVIFAGDANFRNNSTQAVTVASPITLTGNVTFNGTIANTGTLTLTGNISESVAGRGITQNSTNITGPGTVTLSGVAGYTGPTTVSGGTLQLGAANRINDASDLVLGGLQPATTVFGTGGFNETMHLLNLSSGGGAIDLGNSASVLHFSNSQAVPWSGTLSINNWTAGADHLFVGSDPTGLTATQLGQITFAGRNPGARILGTGEIVALPSTLLGDLNQDDHVNVADISALMNALANLSAYQATYGLTNAELLMIGDVAGPNQVNNADVQGLINLLANGGGSGALAAVPEPAGYLLLALGGIIFVLAYRFRFTITSRCCSRRGHFDFRFSPRAAGNRAQRQMP